MQQVFPGIWNEAIVPREQLPCNFSREQPGHLFQRWDSTFSFSRDHWSLWWKTRNVEWDSLVLACLVACLRHRNLINCYLWMESPAVRNQKHPNYAFGVNNGKDSFSLLNWQERSFFTRKNFQQQHLLACAHLAGRDHKVCTTLSNRRTDAALPTCSFCSCPI